VAKPKPLPKITIPPPTSRSGKPADVPAPLWDAITKAASKYGVTPQVLAGIWRVESGSTYPNPAVNSLGYGGLFGTTKWNAPTQEQADYSASILRNLIRTRGNLHDALLAYSGGGYSDVPGVSVPRTPEQKAQDAVRQGTATAQAQASSPAYVQATTDISVIKSQAVAAAKAASGPWVVLKKDGTFDAVYGKPPVNAVLYGGQPIAQSQFGQVWDSTYGNTFEAFTGRKATPQEIVDILQRGISVYALQTELSKKKTFVRSPIYKQNAAGIADAAKGKVGKPAPKDFVRRAIAEQWDAATLQANIKKLPGYEASSDFKAKFSSAAEVYRQIYGTPDALANTWLKKAALNDWTQADIAARLRAAPEYRYSPEGLAKATTFLDAMGLFTGSRPTLTPEAAKVIAKATKGKPALSAPLALKPNLPGTKGSLGV
jgi:hypothetical protein